MENMDFKNTSQEEKIQALEFQNSKLKDENIRLKRLLINLKNALEM